MSEREPTLEERAVIETAEKNGRRIVKEPLIYQAEGARSYFSDLAMRERGNTVAAERLAHHERQMAAIPTREVRTVPGTEFEYRVPPNVTTGTGGEFAPPLWVNELFATARRPGQIIQRLAHTFDLPGGVSSVNLPKITQGSEADSQTIPGAPVPSQDVETATVKSKAITFAGNSDWSIQALEQSPKGAYLDWVVFTDLTESLDANVEVQLVNGRGEASEELLGLLNITGINAIAYTSLEAKTIFATLGKAMAKVGIERKRPPDAWLMTTARVAYLATVEDTEQRPLILTDNVGESWPSCSFASVGVYPDDAIPRTVNVNQEPVFCVRSDDFMIWLSSPRTMVMEDILSGSLGVRFQLHRTVAALLHRYPSGISAITGAGMKPASEF